MQVRFVTSMTTVLLSVASAATVCQAAAPPAQQPAAWMEHVVVVNLQNLPKAYTCDELWYKFRDSLLVLGARPDFKITAQQCSFKPGSQQRSPQVELHFYLAKALSPAQARYADVMVVPTTGALEPNTKPHSFDKSDCELVRQMSELMLPAVPVTVGNKHFDCAAPGAAGERYSVSVQSFTAAPDNASGASAPAH
jgi:hypothetical protein